MIDELEKRILSQSPGVTVDICQEEVLKLIEVVKAAREIYAQHTGTCGFFRDFQAHECDCGVGRFRDALKEIK